RRRRRCSCRRRCSWRRRCSCRRRDAVSSLYRRRDSLRSMRCLSPSERRGPPRRLPATGRSRTRAVRGRPPVPDPGVALRRHGSDSGQRAVVQRPDAASRSPRRRRACRHPQPRDDRVRERRDPAGFRTVRDGRGSSRARPRPVVHRRLRHTLGARPALISMAAPKVYVTRQLSEVGLAPLRAAGLDVVMRRESYPVPRSELLAGATGATALVSLMSDQVDAELLDTAGPQLRIVANYAVGYDNIDVAECHRRGIVVANTPDVLTDATADHAFGLLLAVARRLREGDQLVRSGQWTGWEPDQLLGRHVTGAVLGIVGMGRIGTAVAVRARAFGMTVLYHNRSAA